MKIAQCHPKTKFDAKVTNIGNILKNVQKSERRTSPIAKDNTDYFFECNFVCYSYII